jgi:hypothetical protein
VVFMVGEAIYAVVRGPPIATPHGLIPVPTRDQRGPPAIFMGARPQWLGLVVRAVPQRVEAGECHWVTRVVVDHRQLPGHHHWY